MPNTDDPGGQFETEIHRRVCAALPTPEGQEPEGDTPLAANDVPERLAQAGIPLDLRDIDQVLNDLVASGDAQRIEGDSYRMTQKGYDAITGPLADEPPPMEGNRLKRAEEADKEHAQNEKRLLKESKKRREAELEEELAALKEEN